MEEIRYGIIGTGTTVGIARNHIRGLKECEGIRLAAIYDIDRTQAERTYQECGLENVVVCHSQEELFSMVDAVGICLPNILHVETAIAALKSGKHVMIEKPVSVDAKSLKPLLEVVEANGKQVAMVCFNYREFPIYRYIKGLIESGTLGTIYHAHFQLGGNRIADKNVGLEWRMQRKLSGEGAISDFGCHLLDITQYLLSSSCGPLTQLKALTSTMVTERADLLDGAWKPVDNDDCGVFIGRMENGAVLSYDTSRIGMWQHSIELEGEGGMVYADFNQPYTVHVWKKEKNGGFMPDGKDTITVSGLDGHAGILQNFADCITGKAVNERSVAYAGHVQAMIDSMACTGEWS